MIKVTWQRLVDEGGETCERCNKTYLNIKRALLKLEPLLSASGVRIIIEKRELSKEEFERDPLSSNRVYIDDEPVEKILSLKVGKSVCCGPCGGLECRTLIEGSKEFEEIPEEYIIEALLRKIKFQEARDSNFSVSQF